MNEDKDQTARAPANDVGDAAVTEFPDEGAATVSPEERVEALEAELAETKDRLLRALAETENVRRRARHGHRGIAAGLCAARSAVGAGDGRGRQGRIAARRDLSRRRGILSLSPVSWRDGVCRPGRYPIKRGMGRRDGKSHE